MPPETTAPADDTTVDDAPEDTPPAPPASTALTPDAVRNSPEYRTLARENRQLARQAGQDRRAAEKARADAEAARLAAEAQQQSDLEDELASILGDEAVVAAWNEISELGQNDPAAAARRFAELVTQARAQNPDAGNEPAAPPVPADQGGTAVDTPPAPSRGLGADASLSQRPRTLDEEESALADDLDRQYQGVVERVQNPETRNRTTWRERTGAMIGFVASSVLRERVRRRTEARNNPTT